MKYQLAEIDVAGISTGLRTLSLAVLLITAADLPAAETETAEPVQAGTVTYADDVKPIMQKHCAECHVSGAQGAKATGFLVDSYETLMKGSEFGPVVTPGSAKTSSLFNMTSGKGNLAVTMPHDRQPLTAEEVETIRIWIETGAPEN